MRDVVVRLGRLLDFVAQLVFMALLVVACGVAEWLLVPAASSPAGAALVAVVLALAGLAAILLCCPRRLS